MSRLSNPESVLNKINDLYQKIEELYDTVDLIRQLREKFDVTCRSADEYESRIGEKLERFTALGDEHADVIARLATIGSRAEDELGRMATEFGHEKAGIHAVLDTFAEEREALRARHRTIDQEIGETVQEMTARLAYLTGQMDGAVEAMHQRAAQVLDEERETLHRELDRVRQFSTGAREEIDQLTENLEQFREQLQTAVEDRVTELLEQQKHFESATSQDLLNRFSEEKETLQRRTAAEIETVRTRFAEELNRVEEALSFLAEEKEAVDRRHSHIDSEMARMAGETEAMMMAARERVEHTITDANAVIEQEINHVASFITESEAEIQGLKTDLKAFRDRISTSLTSQGETLTRQQNDFQETISREIDTRLSEEARNFRTRIDQEVHALAAEKKEIAEMHQALDETLDQVNRKIAGKSTYFTKQLNTLIVNTRQEITRLGETATRSVEERLEQLSTFSEDARTEMRGLKTSIQSFAGQVREKLDRETKALHGQQSEFQKSLNRKLVDMLSEEARKMETATRERVISAVTERFEKQNRMLDRMKKTVGTWEDRITALEAARETARAEQKQRDAALQKHLKRIVERQKTFSPLEERVKALEAQLEEIQQKKGLLRFSRNRKE